MARALQVNRWRILHAYRITIQILLRYLFLFCLKKILKPNRVDPLFARAHEKTSRTIVDNILKLKGLYIKIGQTLSIMTNFLPESFRVNLEQLQDSVPPHPYEEIEERFIQDFQKTPEELYQSFNKEPLASASLAQVHQAISKDGKKLAVKLQYPNIDQLIKADLKAIKKIFGWLNFIFPDYGLKEVYEESSKMILDELDYKLEADSLEKLQSHFQEQTEYVFPRVYRELSSHKVLTMEFVEGHKISNLEGLQKAQIDSHDIAVKLIHFYCKQIFVEGFYHADPHPGNILIQAGTPPKIAMLDYGATAQISPSMREGITAFVEGLIKKDTKHITMAMRQMGFVARDDNEETIDKIVEYFYSKIRGIKIDNLKEIDISQFQSLDDLFELKKMDISFRELTTSFHVPKDWILLERTLLILMGLITHLDPKLNPLDIIIPYVENFVLGEDKTVADLILESSKELLLSYIQLPAELQKTMKKLNEGQIKFRVKDDKKNSAATVAAINRLIYTLLLISSIALHLFFKNQNLDHYAQVSQYVSLAFGLLLIINFIKGEK